MGRLIRLFAAVLLAAPAGLAICAAPAAAAPAATGAERDVALPDGSGSVPAYRGTGPAMLVCGTDKADFDQRISAFPAALKSTNLTMWTACQKSGQHSVQAAVDLVTQPGGIIKVLPGAYLETASLATPSAYC